MGEKALKSDWMELFQRLRVSTQISFVWQMLRLILLLQVVLRAQHQKPLHQGLWPRFQRRLRKRVHLHLIQKMIAWHARRCFFVAVCNFYVSLHKNSHSIYDKTWSSTVLISSTKMFRRYIHLHFGLWIWWPCSVQMKLRKAAKARLMRWCKPHAQRVSMEAPEWVKEQWAKQNKNMVADLFSKVNFNQDICTAIGAHFVCSRSQHHAFQNTSKIKGGIQRPAHHHGQEEAVGGVECGGRLVLGVWDEKRPALEPVLVSELLFPKN